MLKIMFILLVLAAAGLAQTSSDGSFSVRHSTKPTFSLSKGEMREAESLYRNACAVVEHDFHSGVGQLHPHLTVIVGEDRNEVHAENTELHVGNEIWMKKWEPTVFAQGVVVLAFGQMLTVDVIKQLGMRAVRYSNATENVAGLK
jgi:hypothetical protein